MKTVKCEITDKDREWKKRIKGGMISLEISKACRLERNGLVRIMNESTENRTKTMTNYRNRALTANNDDYLSKSQFSSKKKVKIAWVQDYSRVNGGAELSNKTVVRIGEDCGFDVLPVTPSNFSRQNLHRADIIIINNFHEFPIQMYNQVYDAIYEKRIPYVKYEHDYRELKRVNISRQMFTNSKLNIFISPEHKKNYIKVLGRQVEQHSICLPLALDVNMFQRNKSIKREKNIVLVPVFRKCKENAKKFINEHQEYKYILTGQSNDDLKGDITYLPFQYLKDMPVLYNKCEFVLHVPDNRWAGDRVYFEAMLCGCKPIINKNVGHTSWEFIKDNVKEKLEKAPYKFWKEIEKCL